VGQAPDTSVKGEVDETNYEPVSVAAAAHLTSVAQDAATAAASTSKHAPLWPRQSMIKSNSDADAANPPEFRSSLKSMKTKLQRTQQGKLQQQQKDHPESVRQASLQQQQQSLIRQHNLSRTKPTPTDSDTLQHSFMLEEQNYDVAHPFMPIMSEPS
ncbi:hypothetical protein PFISCL1PPCAC_21328, partial [Pristionchus fissidentatus]